MKEDTCKNDMPALQTLSKKCLKIKPVRPMEVLTCESFEKLRIKSGHRQDYKGRLENQPAFSFAHGEERENAGGTDT